MDIIKYVEKYGDKTSQELPFTEVDYTIFSGLGYINLDGIVSINNTKITLEKIGEEFFNKYTKKDIKNNIMAVVNGIGLLEKMYKTKRYKDIEVYNYIYKSNINKQFSAMFMDINEKETFILFEGTDDLISGWKEDAALSYEFPTEGQADAIDYINSKIPLFSNRKYILGGHSKGGNLALVAGMYTKWYKKNKIKKIYSFDGPGLKLDELNSIQYKSIENRFELIIPDYSVVGLLLRHNDNRCTVIKANTKSIISHSMNTWEIENTSFIRSELSDYSKKIETTITRWLDLYDLKQRKKFFTNVFGVAEKAGVVSLLDLKITKVNLMLKLVKESKTINKESKEMINKFINFLFDNVKEYIKDNNPFSKK